MNKVVSADGTAIAYDRIGDGPAVVLVDGAFCHRSFGPMAGLAAVLAKRFTVYTYDRRGRGDSGDTQPYAPGREIEDLAAIIDEAGGSAYVYGISSGAALALEAANKGLAIGKLALYEAPFIVDDSRKPVPPDYLDRIREMTAADRRGDLVSYFMGTGIGVPAVFVALMRLMPAWSKLKAAANTLVYDVQFVEEHEHGRPLPRDRWSAVAPPTLVAAGARSPAWMRTAMGQLTRVLPNAQLRILPGQTHQVKPEVIGTTLIDFFEQAGSPY